VYILRGRYYFDHGCCLRGLKNLSCEWVVESVDGSRGQDE